MSLAFSDGARLFGRPDILSSGKSDRSTVPRTKQLGDHRQIVLSVKSKIYKVIA
jgi:hypothetical protein